MITRFNKYEQKLNEESVFPDWVEQRLVKPVSKLFGEYSPSDAYKAALGEDELSAGLKQMYNTPIANLRIGIYAQLMEILKEDELSTLKLEEPLTVDSTMIEVTNNYYIKNIIEILNEISSMSADFEINKLDESVLNDLKSNPITIGTIITNSLKGWYESEQPINSLVNSLNNKVIEPNPSGTNESLEYGELNERYNFGRASEIVKSGKSLFKGIFTKTGETLRGVAKDEKGIASAVSHVDDEVKSVASGVEKINVNASQFSKIDTEAMRKIPGFENVTTSIKFKGEEAINSGKIDLSTPIKENPRKVENLKVGEVKIGEGKKGKANDSIDANKKSKWDEFWENHKKKKEESKRKSEELKSLKDQKRYLKEQEKLRKLEEQRIRQQDRTNKLLSWVSAYFKGKMFTAAIKWGAIGYGIYWLSQWFDKSNKETANEPITKVLTALELEMFEDKFEPFLTFHNVYKIQQEKASSGDPHDFFKVCVESLESNRIMSSDDAKKCLDQIASPTFNNYLMAMASPQQMLQSIQTKWESSFQLPTPGLYTFGTISAYAAMLSSFENFFFSGNVPITADSKNLDKPIGLIKRFDNNGQERQYMQIGDTGSDVKLLQDSLKKINLYDGEVNGIYDVELSKIVAGIQTNGKYANDKIEINGKADVLTLAYLAKQIELLNMATPEILAGVVSPEEIQSRQNVQGYIQQMQSVLTNR
jgi:hypothetical protein